MKPVLILTAAFGEGHNAAARNVRDALLAVAPDARVEVRDVFRDAYARFYPLATRGYLMVINHAPGLWNLIFQWLHRSRAVPEHMGRFRRASRELRRTLDALDPGVVVSTYPGCNHLLDRIEARGAGRPYRQVTVVTDSVTINAAWHSSHSDFYLVANEASARVMRADGVDPAKIRVTGFPVPGIFAELRQPKSPPAPGGKWKVLFMVNAGKRIAADVVARLARIDAIELTVTVGRDDALLARIESVARAAGRPVALHGWTDQMPRLMAASHIVIGKAGGASVQEALAAETPMIVSQIVPGQEEGNASLIAESGAGMIAATPGAIESAVRAAIAGGGAQWSCWHEAARRLSRPGASREIAQWLVELSASEGAAPARRESR